MQLKDKEHRFAAAVPAAENIIVEAGAGTGKTTLLIDRLCYILLGLGIPADKIAALTFTDKAAAEIKLRLQAKMQIILAQLESQDITDEAALMLLNYFGKTKEQIRKNIQSYFDLAERAQVCTIHSFCLNILHEYPLEAGLAPDCAVDSGGLMEKLFNAKWTAFLEEQLSFDNPAKQIWQDILDAVKLEDVQAFAWTIIENGAFDYHPLNNTKAAADLCADYILKARQLVDIYKENTKRGSIIKKLDAAIDALEETQKFLRDGKFEKSANEIGSMPSCPKHWAAQDYETAQAILKAADALNINKQIIILKAFGILSPFIKSFAREFRKENTLSFSDIISKTRALLINNFAVRDELKARYQSILIDEFQDTDPAQGEIMLFLAESSSSKPATKWQDIVLENGKLFVVGDPKQTIYNFRGADINAYERFTDLMMRQGAKRCFLQTNFRSSAQIIDFANTAGAALIQEQKGVQPAYIPIDNGRDFCAPPVGIIAVNAEQDIYSTQDYRHNQAQYIAAWIKENARKTKTADGSPLMLKDIAILLKTTTALGVYTAALDRFGIKYTVEADNNFYTSQEVCDFLNILKVIYNPLDKAALTGVLRSPLGLVKDADIIKLKMQNRFDIFAPQPDDIPNAKKVFTMLKELYNLSGKISLRKLVSKIIFDTDFLEMQTVSTAKEQAVANIYKLFNIVADMRGLGVFSLGQFLHSVKEFTDKEKKEGASPLTEESLDTVNIMTIHKAKGLEFKAVIVTDISKRERPSLHRPEYIFDWDSSTCALRLGALGDANFAVLEPLRLIHGRAEELRVLYVALTRAKEMLLLAGDLCEDKNSLAGALQKAGLFPLAASDELKSANYNIELNCPDFKEVDSFINTHTDAQASAQPALDIPAWLEVSAERKALYDKVSAQKFLTAAQSGEESRSALTGSVSHKMMESIFTHSLKTAAQCAAVLGVNLSDEELKTAQDIADNFKKSALYDMLKNCKRLAAELPFTLNDGQAVTNGVIDAVFETPQNTLLIADYKTDNIRPQDAKEHSLKYAPQLAVYKKALAAMMPAKQLQAAIIYLRTQQIIFEEK